MNTLKWSRRKVCYMPLLDSFAAVDRQSVFAILSVAKSYLEHHSIHRVGK